MPQITFKRTATRGLVANVWVYDGTSGNLLCQIPFVNDEATVSLNPGNYMLHWALSGFPGDELKLDRKKAGDAAFTTLISSSKIPKNDHATATGTRLTVLRNMLFTVS